MAVDLEIINNFSVESDGVIYTGKQGDPANVATDPHVFSVTGDIHAAKGSLASGAALTVYDNDDDTPTAFVYAFYVADVDSYIQIVGATGNAIHFVEAYVPFVIPGADEILVAANTTKLTGTPPVMEAIDCIVIQNNSGGPMRWAFVAIN